MLSPARLSQVHRRSASRFLSFQMARRRSGGGRLGPNFTRLLSASAIANVGDGVRLAAGPLLIASLTSDPVLVAGAVVVQQLPWLVLSLPAGAVADRFDRRRLLVAVVLSRALIGALLAAALAAGIVNVPLVYAALFLVGLAEVVTDTAAGALLPEIVSADELPRANGRLVAAVFVGNQFAGPPFGALLFAAGNALPFAAEAAGFAVAAMLLARLRTPLASNTPSGPRPRGWLRQDIREGVRWLANDAVVRLLAVVLGVMNFTFMLAFSVWVLYAQERLGLSPIGFGLLLTASAVGGLAGGLLTGRLTDLVGPSALLRCGLVIETGVHLVLAVTRDPWVAGVTMAVFGFHAAVWGVVALSLRQRLVPAPLRARVNSVYVLITMAGGVLGAMAGGFLARAVGLAGPFWTAAAGNVVLILVVWRRLAPGRLDRLPQAEAERDATPTCQP